MIAACSAVALGFPGAGHAGGLETFAHALTRHHIALTKSALLEALQNPDAEVRGLAAWQLAETKQKDCLPQILRAARDEKNPDTRVNIASAAGNLGST
jgi:HEAT repeat protein